MDKRFRGRFDTRMISFADILNRADVPKFWYSINNPIEDRICIDFGSSIRIYTLERGEKLGESEYIKWEDALEDFAERIELNYTKRIKKELRKTILIKGAGQPVLIGRVVARPRVDSANNASPVYRRVRIGSVDVKVSCISPGFRKTAGIKVSRVLPEVTGIKASSTLESIRGKRSNAMNKVKITKVKLNALKQLARDKIKR